jgi:hypothetical protein
MNQAGFDRKPGFLQGFVVGACCAGAVAVVGVTLFILASPAFHRIDLDAELSRLDELHGPSGMYPESYRLHRLPGS